MRESLGTMMSCGVAPCPATCGNSAGPRRAARMDPAPRHGDKCMHTTRRKQKERSSHYSVLKHSRARHTSVTNNKVRSCHSLFYVWRKVEQFELDAVTCGCRGRGQRTLAVLHGEARESLLEERVNDLLLQSCLYQRRKVRRADRENRAFCTSIALATRNRTCHRISGSSSPL